MTTIDDIGEECSHEFELQPRHRGSYCILVTEVCSKCKEERSRTETVMENFRRNEKGRLSYKRSDPFHEIIKATEELSGCEAMDKFAEFKEKYPEYVHIAHIDDSYHSNSDLVFIERRTDAYYWGTSVIVVPQCSGEATLRFFMYPSHMQSVLEAFATTHMHKIPNEFEYDYPELSEEDDPWVVVRQSQVKNDG